jgi:hypothetical protein
MRSSSTIRGVLGALALVALMGSSITLISPLLARKEGFPGQYHSRQMTVSRTAFPVVSVSKSEAMSAPFSSDNALEIPRNEAGKGQAELVGETEAVQYQKAESQHDDRRLMLRIAVGLGLAYVGFVACWIWVTRLRSRPPSH